MASLLSGRSASHVYEGGNWDASPGSEDSHQFLAFTRVKYGIPSQCVACNRLEQRK